MLDSRVSESAIALASAPGFSIGPMPGFVLEKRSAERGRIFAVCGGVCSRDDLFGSVERVIGQVV